jgi:ABC-2 type transport system permease protein
MNVPREMFPVASVMVTTYHAFPQYVILVIACLLLGWSPDPTDLVAGALGVAIILTISLAVALAFSALNVSFRDFGNFVETVGMMVMWSAPMLYPWEFVAEQLGPIGEQVYLANPVAMAALLNQQAFWVPALDSGDEYTMPDHLLLHGGIMLVCCLGLVGVAQLVFARLEHGFAEKM